MTPLLPAVAAFLAQPQIARIGGRQVQTNGPLIVLNPSDETELATVAACSAAEVDLAVAAAQTAFDGGWRNMLPDQRSRILWRLADMIEDRAEVLGQLDALDNGKPIAKARDVDAFWSARHLRYFAGWPDKIEGTVIPVTIPDRLNCTRVEPLGVCGLICPWIHPLLMAMWKPAPALAAGNTVVLKPSEGTPLSDIPI